MEQGTPVPRKVDKVVWQALTHPDYRTELLAKAAEERPDFSGETLEELAQALTQSPELQAWVDPDFAVDNTLTL